MAWLPWHCHVGSTSMFEEGWLVNLFFYFCQRWCNIFFSKGYDFEQWKLNLIQFTTGWSWQHILGNGRSPGNFLFWWHLVCFFESHFDSACSLLLAEVGQNGKIHLEEGRTNLRNQRNLSKHWKICLGHRLCQQMHAIMIGSQDMMKLDLCNLYALLYPWSLQPSVFGHKHRKNTIIYPRVTVLIRCSKSEPEALGIWWASQSST